MDESPQAHGARRQGWAAHLGADGP